MSAYANDRRVKWPRRGDPPDVFALVDDPDGQHEGWVIMPGGGGFLVRRAISVGADPIAEDRRGFTSVDQAIRSLIGDPR